MGFLSDLGPIQNFEQTIAQQKILKRLGIVQFLYRLKTYRNWKKPQQLVEIKWGQQIEGHFLKQTQKGLQLCQQDISTQYNDLTFPLMFQYGSWMFEMIPKDPYCTSCNFQDIIKSLRNKYQVLHSKSRIALTIPVIPFMGVILPNTVLQNQITNSQYIDDFHIANHPRFRTLTKNIRLRRGRNVDIFVPLFKDVNTDLKIIQKTQPKQGFIHMDAMAFGMGSCCLQCTFSTKNLDHARYVYDQLNVISPIFLALTAGSPLFKGKVSDWDVRWNIISDSVDDRNEDERNPKSKNYIPTSRYGEANYFLSNDKRNLKKYNDFNTGVRQQDIQMVKILAKEKEIQMDQQLIFHIANIFRRDYLIVHQNFKNMSQTQFLLFDMLNGTNWNSVRLKIPIDDEIGWRVQFRTMEVQLTPDQNAAYSLLIHLIARVLHQNNDLNLYIPISLIRQNFKRAHLRDALRTQKFYFRTNILSGQQPIIQELTIHEILFGKENFKGLFFQIQKRLECCLKVCEKIKQVINSIKEFLIRTTSGARLTLAQWIRNYVDKHPLYKHDSILPKQTMDDLLLELYRISKREVDDENFKQIFSQIQEPFVKSLKCRFNKQGDKNELKI